MDIRDLGEEAIQEILAEATDGMHRRTGHRGWTLVLDKDHGDLRILKDRKPLTTANVRPHLDPVPEGQAAAPEAIRYRSALRRLVLEATQAVTPVTDAADIPAALAAAFSAIRTVDTIDAARTLNLLPNVRHDLHRILDHLTGNDHSGCSNRPSVADYGRPADEAAERVSA